jgi:hypothetical protein
MLVTVIQSAAWQPLATLGAAFVAALLGSWGGAEFAMRRFRRERAFDRRLVWSEQMARRLAEVKLNIEVATTLQEDTNATDHERGQAWSTVNQDYLKLILDEALAPLYGRPDVVDLMRSLIEEFNEVSEETNGFDVHELPKHLDRLGGLVELIAKTEFRHAIALRHELGLEPLSGKHGGSQPRST